MATETTSANLSERDQRRQMVLEEVASWKHKDYGDLSWHVELNSFMANLPSEAARKKYGQVKGERPDRIYAYMTTWANLLDTKFDEINSESPGRQLQSQLYLSQTPREFFQVVDAVIADLPEVTFEEINRLAQIKDENSVTIGGERTEEERIANDKKLERAIKAQHELYEYALPVYIELRVLGYSQYDLTG